MVVAFLRQVKIQDLDAKAFEHDINAYINMLGLHDNIALVGAPERPLTVSAFALRFGRKSLSGPLLGGIAERQEMFDFCGEHNITAGVFRGEDGWL